MADAMEALRQDVEKESANELAGLEGHGLEALAPALTVILPSEGDAGLVGFDQAAVESMPKCGRLGSDVQV